MTIKFIYKYNWIYIYILLRSDSINTLLSLPFFLLLSLPSFLPPFIPPFLLLSPFKEELQTYYLEWRIK